MLLSSHICGLLERFENPPISQNGIISQIGIKNARGSRRSTGLLFGILLSLLRFLGTLSPLTVLPVVRSAPHGRRMPMGLATISLCKDLSLSSPSLLPFITILLSIPFPNCSSAYSPTLCGRSSFYCLYSISFSLLSLAANRFFLFSLPYLSPITPTLLFLSLFYYTITTFLSLSHSSTYDNLIC